MDMIGIERKRSASNYHPLPVVLTRGEGAFLWDEGGRRYLDFMSAYSAVSHGHAHPRLVEQLKAQAERLAIVSRAFHSDRLGPFLERLCILAGLDKALPMNTGAEAVETAIKAARRWGYRVKGIAADRAGIIVAENNFHGRTTTIVGFSTEPAYRRDFGPFTPGFRAVPFGDAAALEAAIGPDTCAVLVEPIQGEAGIIVPPDGWLREVRTICDRHNVLLILDEIQSGLGRTGRWFAFQHEGIVPDGLILGKALGGGLLPVSAFLARNAVMDLFEPGSHGSTFGGNPLAAAVALEALNVIEDEQLCTRSAVLGRHLMTRLEALVGRGARSVRGRGLWAGVEIDPAVGTARLVAERLAEAGVLTKETHDTVIRIAPPLVIGRADLDWGLDRLEEVLDAALASGRRSAPAMVRRAAPAIAAEPAVAGDGARLLMCPPDHFEVSYAINPWMDPAQWSASAARLAADAREGWARLRDTYRGLGVAIEVEPPVAGLPDMVFTANAAVVMDRKVVLARFRHPERQGETAHNRTFFEGLERRGLVDGVEITPEGVDFEGAGDCIWDAVRGLFWMGWGQRSDLKARETIERVYGLPALSLRLVDPRFYHLDTAFCALSGGEILYYPPAFDAAGQALLRDIAGAGNLIAAGDDDANTLAVNSVCLGRDVVFGACSGRLEAQLAERGYRVHRAPLAAFGRSGGSAYCLTLRLDRRSGRPAVATGRQAAE